LLAVLTVSTTLDVLDGGTLANPKGPDGLLSLREAIQVANLSLGPDTILLPKGTYLITRPHVPALERMPTKRATSMFLTALRSK
jgi:hypothetical protein